VKITKNKLKQIIKEELAASLNEGDDRYWQSQQNALGKMNRNRGPSTSTKVKWAMEKWGKELGMLSKHKNLTGAALRKLPFVGGVLTGAGLLLVAQEAYAAEGPAGVMKVMADPKNQQDVIEGLASLTGLGSAALIYKEILNSADLKLSKSDAFRGPAPAHTRVSKKQGGTGKLGRNCWGTPDGDPEVEGKTTSAGTKRNYAHCSEVPPPVLESKLTKNYLKQLIKEELDK